MLKRVLLLSLFLLVASGLAFAQDEGDMLAYGDTGNGEITNREYEIPFTFKGRADDVVVIEMNPVDTFGTLTQPALILLDEDNDVVADTSMTFAIGGARIATRPLC
jgi:hypothetical protein